MILKLKEAGDEMTLALSKVEVIQGNYGKDVKFTDANGDDLYVPLSSVERQLDRCGVAEVSDLTGMLIHFSRAASSKPGGKPFWNLDKARDSDVVRKATEATNGKPTSSQADAEDGFLSMIEKYGECFTEALGFAERIKKEGIPTDASAVSAIASTLFIHRIKVGV